MRVTIGGPPRHKPAYQLADRVKCRECAASRGALTARIVQPR